MRSIISIFVISAAVHGVGDHLGSGLFYGELESGMAALVARDEELCGLMQGKW